MDQLVIIVKFIHSEKAIKFRKKIKRKDGSAVETLMHGLRTPIGPMKPFFIENFWAWADNLGRKILEHFQSI